MQKNYIFHSACFDRELFRKQVIALDENGIDYKVINRENKAHARAPLSGYFESEIHVHENDYEKADRLLKELIEKYS
jgi:hypothetical protein